MSSPLWTPRDPESTRISRFRREVSKKHGLELRSYDELWQWSIEHIDLFWADVWEHCGIIASKPYDSVVDTSASVGSNPTWFAGARLNWAENMLRFSKSDPDRPALIQFTEPSTVGDAPEEAERLTYGQLHRQVYLWSSGLRKLGIRTGDVVAYYGSNCNEAVIACLATAAIGAIWTSCAADVGVDGVLDRLVQLEPKVLISINAVRYAGKTHSHFAKLQGVVDGLKTPPHVFVVDYIGASDELPQSSWRKYTDLLELDAEAASVPDGREKIAFEQLPFDHPLWVLFSSGTTGLPKGIVHRAGGMLIQSLKENLLHGDMTPDDVFFYFSSTSWMMWNFLIAGLATGAAIILFDGSPLADPSLLWKIAEQERMTIFGTSAKYIDVLSKSYKPSEHHDLSRLRMVYSTGSPLAPPLFDWIYSHIKSHLVIGSITGGTDICSLFAGANVALPVYRGEIQCRNLGMAVDVYEDGKSVVRGTQGELVCTVRVARAWFLRKQKAFPCQPIFFWNDKDGARYRAAYFERFGEAVWTHGDHVILTENGGLIMLGRSDGVLNPQGVRFGSSEIYDALANVSEIVDSVAVGQAWDGDERVVLFVQLQSDQKLDSDLTSRIKKTIRERRSPRHVPAIILQVADIPHTLSNKKVEVPIKKLLAGAPKSSLNLATLRNPESIDEYIAHAENLRAK